MNGNKQQNLCRTDAELLEIEERFIKRQVAADTTQLTKKEQQLIAIVSLVVQHGMTMLGRQAAEALNDGLTPVEVREAVYQCAPYVGFPRVEEALAAVNDVLEQQGITLPLEAQATVTAETRFEKGLDAQTSIFGDAMRKAAEAGYEKMPRTSRYLCANCFGDYYTRNGLSIETREMLTLAILTNLGTLPQIAAHIQGNANLGRSRDFISDLMYCCLPYMGYPRLLNALNCLRETLPKEETN